MAGQRLAHLDQCDLQNKKHPSDFIMSEGDKASASKTGKGIVEQLPAGASLDARTGSITQASQRSEYMNQHSGSVVQREREVLRKPAAARCQRNQKCQGDHELCLPSSGSRQACGELTACV